MRDMEDIIYDMRSIAHELLADHNQSGPSRDVQDIANKLEDELEYDD